MNVDIIDNNTDDYSDISETSSDIETSETSSKSNDKNIPDAKDVNFTSKEMFYYKMVDRYFKNSSIKEIEQMIDIINGKSNISLRLLDWFVTRYAKKYKSCYVIGDNDRFNVHISYKAQLKSYKKKHFDPFRRRKKFYYYYDKTDNSRRIHTTIGQLNFFRWAFTNNVIKYVEDNYNTISPAMFQSNKEDKKRKQKNTQLKTKNITSKDKVEIKKKGVKINAHKRIVGDEMKIILSFD